LPKVDTHNTPPNTKEEEQTQTSPQSTNHPRRQWNMQASFHPDKHLKPHRRLNEESIPIRGNIPSTNLVQKGECRMNEAWI